MPERKRRPTAKRTAAKRTPAKKTQAKKPAPKKAVAPVEKNLPEENVADEQTAVEPEIEKAGTPSADESTPKAAEAAEPAEEPAEEPAGDPADETPEETAPKETAPEETASEEPGDDTPEPVSDEAGAEVAKDAPAEPEAAAEALDEPEPAETEETTAAEETTATAEAAPADAPADESVPEDDEPVEAERSETDDAEAPVDVVAPAVSEEPEKPEEAEKPAEPAEEPEEEPAPLVGRARLFDALTHFRRGQVAVAALLCVLGYGAVVQVQTNDEDSTYAGLREQELIDVLSGLAGTTQKAQEQIEDLEATRDELEDQTLQQQTALQRAEEQVDTLRVIAGTVPVSGPGIMVEIDPGADPLRLTGLLDLIEELRTSGAEAMEIEGADGEAVRLVASSSIEVSQPAPGLNVSGEMISPPYRLKVIGPPDTLAGAIDFYQGPQDQLEEQGAEVKVDSEEKIDIESIHTVSR
ncbi:uncharacterized protein YlxW (UPF0749 family) [Nocardioides luteus]|uniref:DUF881 domain-containing protein n=1 Tax=Nocardioides luteus TaxID=1844 RepID=A0ABQ5T0E7_9ACTN|nr:DUF881 domain-containing protein [Nocardioides luteus]MDR7310505.1 uncharacterized protein YlxW (UPF0749 family) [Nocardioides luteus]GGR42388.1 hypothetical protein GCM10010197_04900 [Nocardioides luteus]GLJ69714.1 hypothetical protein GCM10017579_37500 [Nocardioides luteus]